MAKTLHSKLIEKHSFAHSAASTLPGSSDIFTTLRHERRILDAIAKDLLQPRPQAVANILEMARNL